MQKVTTFITSSIGGKIIMALSGAMIILFLLGHALGNLLIFSGQDSLNSYAYWLQNSPFLWVFRLTMLSLLLLHVILAIRLFLQNNAARPVAYGVNKDLQLSYSAKSMIISGLIIFIFICFHIAHLTLGWVSSTSFEIAFDQALDHKVIDVYANVVRGFRQPAISVFYLLSLLVIALHLHHSIKSLFQTLGFHHQNFHQLLDVLAPILIIALTAAFMSIPLAAWLGYLPLAELQR